MTHFSIWEFILGGVYFFLVLFFVAGAFVFICVGDE